jgi:hypothetical protein
MTGVDNSHIEKAHDLPISALRVLVVRDNAQWFARGIEIDYAASGDTMSDVQRRFERGFLLTVRAHLDKFGTINRLLKWAPSSVVEEYERGKDHWEAHYVRFCDMALLEDERAPLQHVPFDGLNYVHSPDVAMAA